ncbi:hypothetical protein AGMMS50239_04070 [Bacteroidia bacterium]|nr:hypothetical protein AGMMS50239_04070 [Bacteroidia bacterium]
MYTFEIISIPKTESFNTEQQLWVLAERNTILTVKRNNDKSNKTKRIAIPDSVFENNTFGIGNNRVVSKLLLNATKDNFDNLKIKITTFNDVEYIDTLDFSSFDSLVEILKDRQVVQKIKLQNKEERINEIAQLLRLKEEEKTKYSTQINEDLQIFFDFQKCGELQNIDDWNEDENIENSLNYIENKLKETIESREKQPLFEIVKKQECIIQ